MPASCDTSILVPALLGWHAHHRAAREQLARTDAIPDHVLVEAYAVLTRLPDARRPPGPVAAEALRALPHGVLELPGRDRLDLLERLGRHRVTGGAAYDGLVAEVARRHGHRLLSADHRARATYDAVGVDYTLIDLSA